MLQIIALILGAVAGVFALTVFRGAPYVPTLKQDTKKALDMAGVGKNDIVVDLGSGDGRLLIEAVKRGARATGFELNPFLVIVSWVRLRRYRKRARVRMADFWRTPLPNGTSVVFVFLADPFMQKLVQRLESEAKRLGYPLILISYGFELPGYQPTVVDRALHRYEIKP